MNFMSVRCGKYLSTSDDAQVLCCCFVTFCRCEARVKSRTKPPGERSILPYSWWRRITLELREPSGKLTINKHINFGVLLTTTQKKLDLSVLLSLCSNMHRREYNAKGMVHGSEKTQTTINPLTHSSKWKQNIVSQVGVKGIFKREMLFMMHLMIICTDTHDFGHLDNREEQFISVQDPCRTWSSAGGKNDYVVHW